MHFEYSKHTDLLKDVCLLPLEKDLHEFMFIPIPYASLPFNVKDLNPFKRRAGIHFLAAVCTYASPDQCEK